MITNLASRATQSSYIRKSKAAISTIGHSETNGGTGGTIISTITSKMIRPNRFNPNRFKTGGIVATAVQPNKRTRKHHHHHHQHQYSSTVVHCKQAQPPIALPIMKHFDTDTEASNVKEFVKKVKTKMKKKKGKTTGG